MRKEDERFRRLLPSPYIIFLVLYAHPSFGLDIRKYLTRANVKKTYHLSIAFQFVRSIGIVAERYELRKETKARKKSHLRCPYRSIIRNSVVTEYNYFTDGPDELCATLRASRYWLQLTACNSPSGRIVPCLRSSDSILFAELSCVLWNLFLPGELHEMRY